MSEAKRRLLVAAGLLLGLIVLFLFAREYRVGRQSDRCVEQLTQGRAQIQTPSVEEQISRASQVDVAYVRPESSKWIRVGLVLSTGSTTAPALLSLVLSREDLPECRFLSDYGGGAFGQ